MGRSRAVLTNDYRYLFAPPAGRGGSGAGGGTFGAEGRHPAYASEEQLYDQRADPVRVRVRVRVGLAEPKPGTRTRTQTRTLTLTKP